MRDLRLFVRNTLLVAGTATVAACGPAAPPQGQRPPPEVGVIEVQPKPFTLTTELPGRTAALRVSEVRPQVTGILQKRLFEEGSTVKAGQVLYQIDPAPYNAAVQRAAAEVQRARAASEVARLKAERFAPLAKSGAVPKQDNDDVQANYRQAQANVQSAQASLDTARIDLGYTRITAPIDGVISESFITEGALVTVGQAQPLARVTQLDPIYVDIQRPTAEMLRLQHEFAQGQLERNGPGSARLELVLEDGSVYPQAGQLQFSGVTVDLGTGSVNLRATFPNPDKLLLPGMYVRGRLQEGIEPNALLVPQRAVSRDAQGAATVYVVGVDNKLEPRVIETRRAAGDAWLVGKGLAAGDRVVVRGPLRLMPGMPVTPVPADAPTAPPGAPAAPAAPKSAAQGAAHG
jgi:membrane fusion protein (multidrug efflux system)